MFKLPTVLVSLNVNDVLAIAIYKKKAIERMQMKPFSSVESFLALLDPQQLGLSGLPRGFVLLLCFLSRLRSSLFSPP